MIYFFTEDFFKSKIKQIINNLNKNNYGKIC